MKLEDFLNEANKMHVIDSDVKKDIMKDLQIEANKMIMDTIIPKMQSIEAKLYKKHKIDKSTTIGVKNLGSAMMHDVFRELIGQGLVASGNLKRRIGF
jgi:hypothetical protein